MVLRSAPADYSRFQAFARSLLHLPPLSLTEHAASTFSTRSFRRFLPTVADALPPMSLACGRTSPPPLGVLACVPSRSRILLKAARCPRSKHLPLGASDSPSSDASTEYLLARPVMLLPILSPSALCARPKASGMLLQNLKVSRRCAPVVFSVNRVLCGPLGSRPRWTFMESSVRRVSSKWPPETRLAILSRATPRS